ncbi:MAG: GDP-mannose 4,6-dehydratase, partial [Bacteroidota bacterium]
MRVLVTGIDGFVGSHAAEFLLATAGVDIHGTILESAPLQNISHIQSQLHLHALNMLDSERFAAVIHDVRPDRIIHLAGQAFVPTAFADPASTFQANIIGGVNVLEAARTLKVQGKANPSVLVVSTGEVYGRVDPPSRLPITEDFPLMPNNPYAASKASVD